MNTFAKKSLGQHFLHDKNICQKIVDFLEISACDHIIEIGPGTGALTNILFKQSYASFTVLEKDDRFVALHRAKQEENTLVIHCDALQYAWGEIENKIKIISNLPYNIASPLMWDIVSLVPKLERAVFMIQNEVALRAIATVNTSAYGLLSIWLQAFCEIEKVLHVNPGAFRPPPKVESAVIRLIKREKTPNNPKILAELVKLCFAQRRKQLGGVLKKSKYASIYVDMLEFQGISLSARAENVSVEQYVAMSDFLSKLS